MIFGRLAGQDLHKQHVLETPPNHLRKTASRGQREMFDGGRVPVPHGIELVLGRVPVAMASPPCGG